MPKGCQFVDGGKNPDGALAFLDRMAQLNSGDQFISAEPFKLQFVHVTGGPRGSDHPSKKRPGYESAAQFALKNSIIHIA